MRALNAVGDIERAIDAGEVGRTYQARRNALKRTQALLRHHRREFNRADAAAAKAAAKRDKAALAMRRCLSVISYLENQHG